MACIRGGGNPVGGAAAGVGDCGRGERRDERLEKLIALCRASGVSVTMESREQMTRLAKTDQHQGVLAVVKERAFLSVEDLLKRPKKMDEEDRKRFYLACDGIEDPHNLGALLRTADAIGVDGVIPAGAAVGSDYRDRGEDIGGGLGAYSDRAG